MKNDAKFEGELTCCFKIDIMNLTNFDPSTQNSQKIELKKYRGGMFDGAEDWCKICRKSCMTFTG